MFESRSLGNPIEEPQGSLWVEIEGEKGTDMGCRNGRSKLFERGVLLPIWARDDGV